MANEYNQANPDGTLVIDDEPVLQPSRVREIVKNALENTIWNINWTLEERAQLQGTMTNGEGETHILNIYFKPLSNTGRTSPNDKRIQLKDLEFIDSEDTINLLLGVYERNHNAIIVGWNIQAYLEPGKNHSAKIHVKKIAQAMRDGFSTFKISAEKKRNSYAFRPDFLLSYMLNIENFYENDFDENTGPGNGDRTQQLTFDPNEIPSEFPRNLIVYGAPGTGKSHELDTVATELFPDDYLRKRVTFYPKYSYSQFAGVYKPTPIYKETHSTIYDASMVREANYQYEPLIDYKFELGPLLEMFCRAIDNPNHNFLLIIEEINRANAASVFGDFFQLLDRNNEGESSYSITIQENILNALRARMGTYIDETIKIPPNLYIWATMNSGDQGVQPMDAAFKRRWTFKYLLLDKYMDEVSDKEIFLNFLDAKISWNGFREVINDFLSNENIPEDKLIGPFFLKNDEFENDEIFVNKILLYLRDDVLRHNPTILFRKSTFSKIVQDYLREDKKPIFVKEVHEALEGLV